MTLHVISTFAAHGAEQTHALQLTTEQARETAMHRQMVSQFQVAQELSQQQHADLRTRFQHLMHDNEALVMRQVGACPTPRLKHGVPRPQRECIVGDY